MPLLLSDNSDENDEDGEAELFDLIWHHAAKMMIMKI